MPRRRLEPPAADRLAAILGVSPHASPATASPQLAGWVPQRISVDPIPASALPASALPAPVLTVAMLTAAMREDNGRHRRPAPPKPAILTVPVALRGVRARPRRLAVLGVLVLLVIAGVVLGIRVAWARSSARPQPVAATAHGPPGGLVSRTVPAAFGSAGAAGLPTAAGVLLVHVVGQVRRPGVVRLPPGARVLDAVQAAGGATSSADLNHLNLARLVADGEQIVVPKPGESILTGGVPGLGGAGVGASGQGLSGVGSVGGLIDLNTADASALDSLPGVGPVLAQRILDWRAQHGRFTSVDELGEVSGIGDKILAQIRPKVTV
ncbi:MAG: helix-hairpin-helix domain-containing protein [Dermatophilaceae bacterium]